MSTFFEVRPGEMLSFHEEYEPGSYAVAWVEAPEFPGGHHPGSKPIAICAGFYKTLEGEIPGVNLWGWMSLGPEVKEMIGSALLEGKAERGKWYYMTVTQA